MKFSKERRRTLADIFSNIASAWFIAGFIAPWFAKSQLSPTLGLDIIVTAFNVIFFAVIGVAISK